MKKKAILKNAQYSIQEELTPMRRQTLSKMRDMCSTKQIHAAWTKNGELLFKKTPDSKIQQLHSLHELFL